VSDFRLELGARLGPDGASFCVWAPRPERAELILLSDPERRIELERAADGYFRAEVPGVRAGDEYVFELDGERRRPDPASRHQPHGVHAASRVVDPEAFSWSDAGFSGHGLSDYVLYELHVGTFTPEGTFDAVIPRLPALAELGVTALEIMPVAEFPGRRNWGYDGTFLFAPQASYGGPDGLKRLVDACHRAGLSAVLDVVYNHLGPEGNYLGEYGPYFTDAHRTPWGSALNLDGPDSDAVRRLLLDNARYWLSEYHFDALRLDAIHGIFDFSARHILAEMKDLVTEDAAERGRPAYLIAESDLNDVRVIAPRERGGHALDAQWSDDFHHSLFTLLGGSRRGYFSDFGRAADLAKALSEGFVYDGRHSDFRRRRHGSSAAGVPGRRLVVYSQNHDQVANGSQGARASVRLGRAQERVAATVLLTSPNTPLLFMGQEYGEQRPFYYFVDHSDAGLSDAVRRGRREEFEAFGFDEDFADPTDPATFARSKLDWAQRERPGHAELLALYRELLRLRRALPALASDHPELQRVWSDEERKSVAFERESAAGGRVLVVASFSPEEQEVAVPASPGAYRRVLATEAEVFGGGGRLPEACLELRAGEPLSVGMAPFSAAVWATD
jgi:maltooligosyltrehalose trehalohydrolase